MMKTMTDELTHKGEAARIAARELSKVSGGVRNQALLNIADRVVEKQDPILDANRIDLDTGRQKGLPEYYLDRMMLDPERLEAIASDVRSVASLPDPVGEVIEMRSMPNGLQVGRRRVPLGVVGVSTKAAPMSRWTSPRFASSQATPSSCVAEATR